MNFKIFNFVNSGIRSFGFEIIFLVFLFKLLKNVIVLLWLNININMKLCFLNFSFILLILF